MKGCSVFIVLVFSAALFPICILSGCSAPVPPGQNATTIPAANGSITESLPPVSLTGTPTAETTQPGRTTRVEPVMLTTVRTTTGSGTVILDDTYTMSIREYKEYSFADLGYEFLYEGDKFQISLQSEKPVIVYVVGYMDAIRIQAPDNAPRYETGVAKLQWGNVAPVFFWERVTDRIGTFSIEDVGRYSFVVDPRWMAYDEDWKTKHPFMYRLRITKL